jgi:uncharacterized protein YlzI (FlbEa/FlbD family)
MKIKSTEGLVFLRLRNQITDEERLIRVNSRTPFTIDPDEKFSPDLVTMLNAGKIVITEDEEATIEKIQGQVDDVKITPPTTGTKVAGITHTEIKSLELTNNLKFTDGKLDTAQDLGTGATPQFVSLALSGDKINIATKKTITNATDPGTAGDICYDSNYIYVCVATNTWVRAAISTWGT